MRSTTYFWLVVVVVITAVLIAGFEKYRAQHLRGPLHHASLSSPAIRDGRADARAATAQSFRNQGRLAYKS